MDSNDCRLLKADFSKLLTVTHSVNLRSGCKSNSSFSMCTGHRHPITNLWGHTYHRVTATNSNISQQERIAVNLHGWVWETVIQSTWIVPTHTPEDYPPKMKIRWWILTALKNHFFIKIYSLILNFLKNKN